jgi:tRNA-dihydrouridine synthase A
MMDWTDRHCRSLHRVLSRRARLYTEMVTTGAVLFGPRERLLGFSAAEHPVAVQLGGSDPGELAQAARICADFGYDEINLNVGCPSDRVQNGRFGACLMREPALVGECVAAMKAAVRLPVTVKCRIGVDDQDPEEALDRLTDRLKRARPGLPVAVNGGIRTMAEAREHLRHVDGVMLGRVAYHEPEILLAVDPQLHGEEPPVADAFEAVEAYEPYVAARLAEGERLHAMTRHMLGLFTGRPGARAYRRHLATEAVKPGANLQTLRDAVAHVSRAEAQPLRVLASAASA